MVPHGIPKWNTISISGYHIREAGSTAVQEVAFTLANAIAYVQAAIDAGLSVDEFAPQLSFFFNAHNELLKKSPSFARRGACGRASCGAIFGARSAFADAALSRADGGLVAHRAAAGK